MDKHINRNREQNIYIKLSTQTCPCVCVWSLYRQWSTCEDGQCTCTLSSPLSPSDMAPPALTTSSATSRGLGTASEPMGQKLSVPDKLFWGYKHYRYVRVCVLWLSGCLIECWYVCLHTSIRMGASVVAAIGVGVCRVSVLHLWCGGCDTVWIHCIVFLWEDLSSFKRTIHLKIHLDCFGVSCWVLEM